MRRGRADRQAVGAAEEDAVLEADLEDPNPDVEELFKHYDELYFQGALAAAGFVVKWGSPLQSSSFGSCTFSKPSNTITLSEPVLQYRSCTDLKQALLHEMIHAIIYVKHSTKACSNHGPVFRAWMDAINKCSIKDLQRPVGGYNITTRHDFEPEEPISFRGVVLWELYNLACPITAFQCESCGDTLPRAKNQGPPSHACCIEKAAQDATCGNMLCRWHNHKNECGGSYENMGLQSFTPVQKNIPKGTQLLLTYPSETSKSKGDNEESNSAELLENAKVTINAEDEHLPLNSLMKAAKRHRSEVVQKAIVLDAEPSKEVKEKQKLVATEKHKHFSPAGGNDAKSLGNSTSKETIKKHKLEDDQKPNVLPAEALGKPKLNQQLVPTEGHKLFSLEVCTDGKSLEISSLQKIGKRRRSEVVGEASVPPDELPKEMKLKQALVASEDHGVFSPGGCNDATSPGNGSSKKSSKQHKPEDIQKPSTLPDLSQGGPEPNKKLVPTETHTLFSLEGCNDAKTPGNINAKKAGKQHKLEDVQRPSALSAASQGKPKLTQELVATETHKLFSLPSCDNVKSPGSRTSKQADEQHKPKSAQKACSERVYPLRRLKKDPVAQEKNVLIHLTGCSHEKILEKSSPKKARKQFEPEDIQKTTMLPAVPRRKLKESSFVASRKQQRKCRRQPARKKEFAVMSEWMNIYESDRSSGSTEPLVNKRTVRRKKERERIQIYSRSKKKADSAPMDDPSIDVLDSGIKSRTCSRKDELAQQSRSAFPCSNILDPISADQVVTEATGLDIVLLHPADAPGSVPSDSAIIDISDDE
ncbi:hypothetical protein EJB05_42977 [Eragrostis curvula]|uniref:SprT-like domain-containing protein n=1 Tax=Eragrostis curvula TaxID=38414 RepID=A0A5J9TFU8_9POAL|nr:hypothetical protein EJB05_42977 [Eragrostis curvula]